MAIEVILFDFGGVLWVPLDKVTVRTRRERLAKELGFEDGTSMWQYFYGGQEWELTKTGKWRAIEMWSALLSPLGINTTATQEAFVQELFKDVGIRQEMNDLLEVLAKSYLLGILSNASDILEWRVHDHLAIGRYFKYVLNSHRLGVAKPEIQIYQMALQKLDVKPSQILFIDDQERNTSVAESLGIRSHIFTSVRRLRQELKSLGILT